MLVNTLDVYAISKQRVKKRKCPYCTSSHFDF